MPLLVTLNINGVEHRVSNEGVALEHYWDSYIQSFTAPQYSCSSDHGGYISISFGSVSLVFDVFSDTDWPPPASIGVKVQYTATTEAEAQLIFEGTAHRNSLTREGVTYDLYGGSYDAEVIAPHTCNSTLDAAIAYLAGPTLLNLNVDYSGARSPSPAVQHTIDSDTLAITILDDLLKFYSHIGYIEDGTLYVIDCLGYVGSRTLTEFDVFPTTYSLLAPTSAIRDEELGYEVVSSYPYGDEYSPGTAYTNIEADTKTHWTNMLTLLGRDRATVSLPLAGTLPKPGERVILVDESMPHQVTATMYIRGIRYDFDNETVECDCDGVLS